MDSSVKDRKMCLKREALSEIHPLAGKMAQNFNIFYVIGLYSTPKYACIIFQYFHFWMLFSLLSKNVKWSSNSYRKMIAPNYYSVLGPITDYNLNGRERFDFQNHNSFGFLESYYVKLHSWMTLFHNLSFDYTAIFPPKSLQLKYL